MQGYKFLGVVALTGMLASVPAVADSVLLPARVQQAAQARIRAGEYPALVIGVVAGSQSRVYSFGELADGKAPTGNSVFEIGSATKTFTGTLLAEAIEAGKLKFDEPVSTLLPGFRIPARDGKSITLGELATQFSGLPRLPTNMSPADPGNPYADYTAAKLRDFLAAYVLPRDPGSAYEYSNLGFGLLGYALAQHAHADYGTLVSANILQPLGMRLSGVALTPAMRRNLAIGHDETGKPVENWDLNALAGAGAIKSTGNDMLRYLEANMGILKTPLTPAFTFAHQPQRAIGNGEQIGLAWMTQSGADGKIIWHNGMTGGYASFIGFTADGRRGVVVLTNIQQSVDDLGFATLLPDAPLAPAEKAVSMSSSKLDDYVGSYQLAPHFILDISRQGDQLYAQATGQGAFPLFASGTDEFFARIANISLSFKRGADQKVNGLILHQNGDHPAQRISAVAAAESETGQAVVSLPPATLRDYVGRYQLTPAAQFDVTLKGNQLYAQLGNQPAFPVFASAKDKFFYTVVNAQLDFVREHARVTALILHQNGQSLRAPRVADHH
ncbi:MAG TPA: serine hydrolase [Gammaproteobacteria bacterium]|nr:serine hydrolase [Gammaproteobacteria bacterium]